MDFKNWKMEFYFLCRPVKKIFEILLKDFGLMME